MPVEINTRPDLREQSQRATLDGVRYQIDLVWRQRSAAWYLDLYTGAGAPLALGRKLVPRWSPFAGITDDRLPAGALVVIGPDDYERTDLGDRLRLLYFSRDELEASAPEADPELTVIIA